MALKVCRQLEAHTLERRRRAASMLEVMVALTLLISVLGLSVTLIGRHARLLTDQRHYRQALDEISNQMDRLTALPAGDVPRALSQLSPSKFAKSRLAAARLTATLAAADVGQRLILRLTWNDRHEQAITMTGWIFPDSPARNVQKQN